LTARSIYVDSNVFISPVIYDDDSSRSAASSKRVLAAIEKGMVVAYTSTLTWDEVVWAVRRALGRPDSIQAGEKLLAFPNLRFVAASEEIIRSAQKISSEQGVAPRDAVHLASALSKAVDLLISDDSDLDILPELERKGSDAFQPSQRSVNE
jgi:predicted nucleic acid-binding protein